MADNYIVKKLTDNVAGNQISVFPVTLIDAIYKAAGDTTTLADILTAITPVQLTRAEYERRVETGEIDDDDVTIYYVPDDDINKFEINDFTISKKTTFSSKRLAEIFASVGISTSSSNNSQLATVIKQTVTLKASDWRSGKYSVNISGVNSTSTVMVEVSNTLSDVDYARQYALYKSADIRRIKKITNTIQFESHGAVPTSNIVVDITII